MARMKQLGAPPHALAPSSDPPVLHLEPERPAVKQPLDRDRRTLAALLAQQLGGAQEQATPPTHALGLARRSRREPLEHAV